MGRKHSFRLPACKSSSPLALVALSSPQTSLHTLTNWAGVPICNPVNRTEN